MAERENPNDEWTTGVPGQGDDAEARPPELFAEENELQWVLVPVSAHDHAQRRHRRNLIVAAIILLLAVFAGWLYKRKVDPILALEAFDSGERHLRSANYSQAVVSFDRAISLRPDFAAAYHMRGRTNLSQNRAAAAIPDFTKVIELQPQDPEPLLFRGMAHALAGEYQEAQADFTRALRLDPKSDEAYTQRGLTLQHMGKMQEALADFDRAVAVSENMENLFQRAATLQALGEHQKAITDLTRVIAFNPGSPQAYFARSLSYRVLGNFEAAEADHELARVLDAK